MHNINYKLIAVLFLLLVHLCSFAYPPLGKNEFETLTAIGNDITAECPKKTCVVIGIGRSPTPIIAYLQAHDQTSALNLPLSDFKKIGLSEDLERRLFDHFDKFLDPQTYLLGKDKIIVLDFALRGHSIISAAYYIRKYLDQQLNSPDTKLEIEAIVPQDHKNDVENVITGNIYKFFSKSNNY